LLTRLINPASHPAAWAPIVSQVWQATKHILRGRRAKRCGDLGVGLWRRFVPLGGVIDAKSAIEEINDTPMGELAAGDGRSVVRQGKKMEACGLQPPQPPRNVGVRRHGGEPISELLAVSRSYCDALGAAILSRIAPPMSVNGT
jgi:hypothetical protein